MKLYSSSAVAATSPVRERFMSRAISATVSCRKRATSSFTPSRFFISSSFFSLSC